MAVQINCRFCQTKLSVASAIQPTAKSYPHIFFFWSPLMFCRFVLCLTVIVVAMSLDLVSTAIAQGPAELKDLIEKLKDKDETVRLKGQ
jgi:hypothetical protein